MSGPVRVSVIIASWNAARVLGPCLDSLERQEVDGGFETIVVNDGSTDDTADVLRARQGRLRVVANETNAGFCAANNAGAAIARGRVLFFLNSDTELLGDDVLERLAAALDDPSVGIVAPKLVNPDGTPQPSCAVHPSVTGALLVATGAHRVLPDRVRARLAPHRWSHDRSIDTGWVMGAALALRSEVFHAVGGWWPEKPVYAEETELAFRVRERGLRVRFDVSAQVMHLGNQSNVQRWSDVQRAERLAVADLLFLERNYGGPRRTAIRAIVWAGYAARAVAHRALGHRDRAGAFRAMARVYAPRATGSRPPAAA
ncbi:MAG TPA: glycosyltransferase [Solirubrobacteraceae bacterium]|nr:glycosyltransferase [Solirubrobacteraceae bacterium]